MIATLNGYARRLPVWAVWLAGLIPLALLVWDGLTGQLGVDPVHSLEHRLGRTALYFLIASLCVTPLLRLTRLNLIRFRRALGLLCFSYAVLHVATWIVADMGLRWGQMAGDLIKRPYLVFGMLAFVILVALAITSNDLSVRRLGRNWRSLHQLVYLAAPLAVVHWLWALKVWGTKPLTILTVILVLLAMRMVRLRPIFGQARPTKQKI